MAGPVKYPECTFAIVDSDLYLVVWVTWKSAVRDRNKSLPKA